MKLTEQKIRDLGKRFKQHSLDLTKLREKFLSLDGEKWRDPREVAKERRSLYKKIKNIFDDINPGIAGPKEDYVEVFDGARHVVEYRSPDNKKVLATRMMTPKEIAIHQEK